MTWLGLTADTDDRQTDHATERFVAIDDIPDAHCGARCAPNGIQTGTSVYKTQPPLSRLTQVAGFC